MRFRSFLAVAACAATFCACHSRSTDADSGESSLQHSPSGLEFHDAWVRVVPNASVSVAYFTLVNLGSETDTLLAASSPVAAAAEVHQTLTDNGTSRMRPAGELSIAPGGKLAFAPGGLHVMLTGITQPLVPGESVPLTLTFREAGSITVALQARDAASAAHTVAHSRH